MRRSKFITRKQKLTKAKDQQRREKNEKEREKRVKALCARLTREPAPSAEDRELSPPRPFIRDSGRNRLPSVLSMPGKVIKAKRVQYEGDMAEREAKAQEEIERKKKRVAPHFNKGAYQYVTDETNPKELGKK